MKKKITAVIYLENGNPISDLHTKKAVEGYETAESLAKYYSDNGADAIFVLDMLSDCDTAHEKNIGAMKDIIRVCDVPVYAGGIVKRFEDVKKYLYTGALKALCWFNEATVEKEIKEAYARFGKDKLITVLNQPSLFAEQKALIEEVSDALLLLEAEDAVVSDICGQTSLPVYVDTINKTAAEWLDLLKKETVCGVTGQTICEIGFDFMAFKFAGKAQNISMNLLESKIKWEQLKLNADGMIPVIVQDYKTDEVLQLAYMNEESFKETLACGKMTYWSRSRDELWTKGETSGHFQYVKSLTTDCDYDTILAKVSQVGAACHTGKRSCFFNEMVKTEYQDTNPLKVFQDVYDVILDRKLNPKEGSYTNYLFDKGIDKILKKVGEEATEIVIAAKNPDAEEIKYEMSDFLYHAMVLMVERGVTWEDITRELAQR